MHEVASNKILPFERPGYREEQSTRISMGKFMKIKTNQKHNTVSMYTNKKDKNIDYRAIHQTISPTTRWNLCGTHRRKFRCRKIKRSVSAIYRRFHYGSLTLCVSSPVVLFSCMYIITPSSKQSKYLLQTSSQHFDLRLVLFFTLVRLESIQ